MKIHMFFCNSTTTDFNTKYHGSWPAGWEVILDQEGTMSLPFGYVEFTTFVTKPTKRQLRRFKKDFRKNYLAEVERHKWSQSWEAIHCDVLGL